MSRIKWRLLYIPDVYNTYVSTLRLNKRRHEQNNSFLFFFFTLKTELHHILFFSPNLVSLLFSTTFSNCAARLPGSAVGSAAAAATAAARGERRENMFTCLQYMFTCLQYMITCLQNMFTCLLQGPETRNQAIYKHTRMAGSQTFLLTSITLYVRVMTENYKNIQYVEHIP